jgi:superoxide reductase
MTWDKYQVGNFDFTVHGESAKGADKGPASTHHSAGGSEKINKSGTLLAAALCNLLGSWENSKAIKVK